MVYNKGKVKENTKMLRRVKQMKRAFKDLANYVKLFDGYNKPKINFQQLYKLFPDFEFTATRDFGNYSNFGQAFGCKNYNMVVSDGKNECYLYYREYQDTDENSAYVSC